MFNLVQVSGEYETQTDLHIYRVCWDKETKVFIKRTSLQYPNWNHGTMVEVLDENLHWRAICMSCKWKRFENIAEAIHFLENNV